MSRSYKHTPYSGDNKGTAKKRVAWKSIRRWQKEHPEILLNGSQYKKIYNSWEICDYSDITSWEQHWERTLKIWYSRGYKYYDFPDKKEEYNFWLKCYKRK